MKCFSIRKFFSRKKTAAAPVDEEVAATPVDDPQVKEVDEDPLVNEEVAAVDDPLVNETADDPLVKEVDEATEEVDEEAVVARDLLKVITDPKYVADLMSNHRCELVTRVIVYSELESGAPYQTFQRLFAEKFKQQPESLKAVIKEKLKKGEVPLDHKLIMSYYLHGTPKLNVASILKTGLDPARSRHKGWIWAGNSLNVCKYSIAKNYSVVLLLTSFPKQSNLHILELPGEKAGHLLPVAELEISSE